MVKLTVVLELKNQNDKLLKYINERNFQIIISAQKIGRISGKPSTLSPTDALIDMAFHKPATNSFDQPTQENIWDEVHRIMQSKHESKTLLLQYFSAACL